MDIFIKNNNKFIKCGYNYSNSEKKIESFLEKNPYVLEENLIIIGRQVSIPNIGKIDLLGLDSENNLVIIEIKKNKAKYDAVGQGHHYYLWARDLNITDFDKVLDTSKLKIPQRLHNERKKNLDGKNVQFNDNTRLYVIAEHISENAITFANNLIKDKTNIECIEIQFYDNGRKITINKILYESLRSNNDELKRRNIDKSVLNSYNAIMKMIDKLNDVYINRGKTYDAFKRNNHNFLALYTNKHNLKAHIVMKNLRDPKKLVKPYNVKKHKNRVWEIFIDKSNMVHSKFLIKQAYKNT